MTLAAGWSRELARPVCISGGRTVRTLQEAADYAMSLPANLQSRAQWTQATALLMQAANDDSGGTLEVCDRLERAFATLTL